MAPIDALVLRWAGVVALTASSACQAPPADTKPTAAPPASVASAAAPEHEPALKLGAPLQPSALVPLAEIAAHTARYAKATVRTEGEVKAVCQAMGCWMEIADPETEAHVRMSGHRFFIPKDAAGRHAVVQAKVLPRPDDGECEEEAKEATGKSVRLELEATGVELL